MFGRKKIIIIAGIASFVLILITGYHFRDKLFPKVVAPVSESQPTSVSVTEEMSTWLDEAEFSFQYPKGLTIDPHEEDQDNYAHVELTDAEKSGNLIVWVKDTGSDTIDDWARSAKIQNAIDSTLGGEPAKKYFSSEIDNQLIITTIRDGYLYQIKTTLNDKEFWQKTYDGIVASFKFSESPKEEKTQVDSGNVEDEQSVSEEVIDEGEEVIE